MTSIESAGEEPAAWRGEKEAQDAWHWRLMAALARAVSPGGGSPDRRPRTSGETFAFADAIRCEPTDRRDAGYYVDNGDDWPDEVSATNISARELLDVVSRFAEVFDSAMIDISQDPLRG
jgi:hypothetical protein